MKICHITTVHPVYDVRIFHKECCSLQKAGHDVTLLAANAEDTEKNGVKIVGVRYPVRNRLERMLKISKATYRKAVQINADIYHFHDPEFLPYALKLLKKGKKVIYDVHEDVPRQIVAKKWIPWLLRRLIAFFFEQYENSAAKKMTHIVSATPFICKRFSKISTKTSTINNYPMLEEMGTPEEFSSKKREVCYLGSIHEERGIVQLIDALSNADFKLNLAGKFDSEELKKQLMKNQGWKSVNDYGFVSREEVVEIMRKSKAGVVTLLPIPNHINSQPNKMFEYMAAGIPIIASDFPLWKEIIEGNDCGICVDPLSSKDICKAVEELLNDNEKAMCKGGNGRKAVEEKYNWETEAKKLIALYEKL
ncbi:MAG: glycosyl transferase [Flavobacteriales bacterium]|nr:glycosyltransferase family 4 protein [Bacteroidales bacterium AH-315-I05]PCJ84666.1 MAG: glycosyl transferase [Flavobacteriales bacterium]